MYVNFRQINEEISILEAAEKLGLTTPENKFHKTNAYCYRCKSIFEPKNNETCTNIDTQKNVWYDHKANKGGKVLQLWSVVKHGDSNPDSIHKAAEEINELYNGKFSNGTEADNKKFLEQSRLESEFNTDVNNWSNELFSDKPIAVRTLQYLKDRGINEETIKQCKIGLCTQLFPTGQKDNSGKEKQEEVTRLAIPYLDRIGNAVYLITRHLDFATTNQASKEQKYKKGVRTKETQYIKSEVLDSFAKNTLFGLNTLNNDSETLFVGEGILDCLSIAQEGGCTLCLAGGPSKENEAQLLKEAAKYRHIILCFDNDSYNDDESSNDNLDNKKNTGKEFAYKMAETLIKAGFQFSVIEKYVYNGTEYKDVNEYCSAAYRDDVNRHRSVGELIGELAQKACNGYIFYAKNLTLHYSGGLSYYKASQKEKKNLQEKINDLFDGLKEKISPEEYKFVREAVLSYYPETLLKKAEKGLEKPDKYKKKICDERDKFLKDNPDLIYTGSVKHGEFYGYNKDAHYWQRLTDANIQSRISRRLLDRELPKTVKDIAESVRMKVTSDERPEFNTKPLFGFKNGVLELDTGIFREHRADDLLTFQVAYNYDKNAICPRFMSFLNEITNENQSRIDFLSDMMAYILYHDCRLEKIFFLIGSGRNGKSVFLHILEALFKNVNKSDDSQSVTHIQPKDFQDPVKRIMLSKSILNIAYDIDYNLKGSESYLKSIASGDVIDGNYKFHDTEHFTSRAKIISSCNHMPVLRDSSEGMTRRPMFCKFEVDFTGRENKKLKDEIIASELPGIFNLIYETYKDLVKRDEIRVSDDQQEYMHEFKEIANPILVFWEYVAEQKSSMLIQDDNYNNKYTLTKEDMYEHYIKWCEKQKQKHILARNIFHKEFKKTLDSLKDKVIYDDKRLRNVYTYIFEFINLESGTEAVSPETKEQQITIDTDSIQSIQNSVRQSEIKENNNNNMEAINNNSNESNDLNQEENFSEDLPDGPIPF